ncbi:MAG: RIO1 family regulatory kinase/ATPase [archaeon]
MSSNLIAQGAEAKIILSKDFIIKDRIKKGYRLPELDEKIRKNRTRKEAKLLFKASKVINCPIPIIVKETKLTIPYIDGKKLSDHLDYFPLAKQKQICNQIGQDIAKLHDKDIIHGDLTTSNMILVEGSKSKTQDDNSNFKSKVSIPLTNSAKKSGETDFGAINRASAPIIFFIDFGLGYGSHRYEDKAVDLHLLKQALESRHYKYFEALFKEVFKGYKKYKGAKKVLERLEKVEKRGRYKH